jgi:hypothetical protein
MTQEVGRMKFNRVPKQKEQKMERRLKHIGGEKFYIGEHNGVFARAMDPRLRRRRLPWRRRCGNHPSWRVCQASQPARIWAGVHRLCAAPKPPADKSLPALPEDFPGCRNPGHEIRGLAGKRQHSARDIADS